VERVRAIEELVREPVGRYFVGATQLVWCRTPTLCGSAHWGRPSEGDMDELARLLDLSLHDMFAGGFDVYMDSRAVEAADWSAFARLQAYVKERHALWSRRIRKQAVIVPDGPHAAVIAGMVPLLDMGWPMRFCTSTAEALAWLARDDAAAIVAEMERLVVAARGESAVLRALRAYLDESLAVAAGGGAASPGAAATVAEAARALRTSPRSLQRALQDHGTRFSAELRAARDRARARATRD
jgi:hypothetical protein